MKLFKLNIFFLLFVYLLTSCRKSSTLNTSSQTDNINPASPNGGIDSGDCKVSKQASRSVFEKFIMNNRLVDGFPVPNDDSQIPGSTSNVALITFDSCSRPADVCTGTFISDHLILTGAHCFTGENQKTLITSSHKFDYNQKEVGIPEATMTESNGVKIHEFYLNYCTPYKDADYDQFICAIGDLAIVKTKKSAKDIGATVARVAKKIESPVLHFVGYGATGKNDYNPFALKRYGTSQLKVMTDSAKLSLNQTQLIGSQGMPAIKAKTVEELFQDSVFKSYNPQLTDFVSSVLILEPAAQNKTGLCRGDSGGGIYSPVGGSTPNPSYAVVAVAHDGTCDNKTFFNVSVGAYIDWINGKMALFGEGPLQVIN